MRLAAMPDFVPPPDKVPTTLRNPKPLIHVASCAQKPRRCISTDLRVRCGRWQPLENNVQCAAKFSGGSGSVCYFRVPFSLATLTMDDGRLDKQTYLQTWRSIPNATEVRPCASESGL